MGLEHTVNNAILKTLSYIFEQSVFNDSVMDYLYEALSADTLEENIDTIDELISETEKKLLTFTENLL